MPATYPRVSPVRLWSSVATKMRRLIFLRCSLFSATTNPQMKAIKMVERAGKTLIIFLSLSLRSSFIRNPAMSGKMTILMILKNIERKSIFMNALANKEVKNGVRSGDKNVEVDVRATEYATSAPARYEITLEAIAPGTAPAIITPTARS